MKNLGFALFTAVPVIATGTGALRSDSFRCDFATAISVDERLVESLQMPPQSRLDLRSAGPDPSKGLECSADQVCVKLSDSLVSCIDPISGRFSDSSGLHGNFLQGEYTDPAGQVATVSVVVEPRNTRVIRDLPKLDDVVTISTVTSFAASGSTLPELKNTLTVATEDPLTGGLLLDTASPPPVPIPTFPGDRQGPDSPEPTPSSGTDPRPSKSGSSDQSEQTGKPSSTVNRNDDPHPVTKTEVPDHDGSAATLRAGAAWVIVAAILSMLVV